MFELVAFLTLFAVLAAVHFWRCVVQMWDEKRNEKQLDRMLDPERPPTFESPLEGRAIDPGEIDEAAVVERDDSARQS